MMCSEEAVRLETLRRERRLLWRDVPPEYRVFRGFDHKVFGSKSIDPDRCEMAVKQRWPYQNQYAQCLRRSLSAGRCTVHRVWSDNFDVVSLSIRRLTTRACWALRRRRDPNRIERVDQVRSLTDAEIMEMRNVGVKTARRIRELRDDWTDAQLIACGFKPSLASETEVT